MMYLDDRFFLNMNISNTGVDYKRKAKGTHTKALMKKTLIRNDYTSFISAGCYECFTSQNSFSNTSLPGNCYGHISFLELVLFLDVQLCSGFSATAGSASI